MQLPEFDRKEKGYYSMTKKRGTFSIILVFSLLLMTFCARTTMDYVWKDPSYQGGKFKKVLVIGVAKNQANRILFENKFVAELKNYGTDAISSYTIIPTAEKLDKVTVESKTKTLEVDAVLVTKLMNIEQKKTYSRVVNPSQTQPRLQRGGYVDYSTDYEAAKDRGSYYKYEVVSLETKIYDTQTDKLIWSGWTDTVLEDSIEVAIGSLIKTITKSLSDNQLI
jgi:hypothetical protein